LKPGGATTLRPGGPGGPGGPLRPGPGGPGGPLGPGPIGPSGPIGPGLPGRVAISDHNVERLNYVIKMT